MIRIFKTSYKTLAIIGSVSLSVAGCAAIQRTLTNPATKQAVDMTAPLTGGFGPIVYNILSAIVGIGVGAPVAGVIVHKHHKKKQKLSTNRTAPLTVGVPSKIL